MNNSSSSSESDIQLRASVSPGLRNIRYGSRDSPRVLNKNKKFDYNEDPIVPYEQQFQETQQEQKQFQFAKQQELEEQLQINLLSLYNPIEIGTQKLPLLLQIDVLKQINKMKRAPLDLVCIVDVSGSMCGMKLKQVQDSLRYITKILNEEDRIAIVSFQNYSKVELPFTRNTEMRKETIKDSIRGMVAGGGTCISSGYEQGIQLIKNRKNKNPATCIFLLSDGQDSRATRDIQKLFAYYELETENFAMHTFGYGEDHDPKIMDSIADLKQGSFSYISNIEKAPDHFILAMSGLLSIYAQNAVIQITPEQPFQVDKIYGDYVWQNYRTQLNYLIVGSDKQILLELLIPDEKQNAIETVKALTVTVTCEHILTKQQIKREKQFNLQITKASSEFNENVYIKLLRAKGGETISTAKDLVMNKKNEQAKLLLQNMLNEILQSPFKDVDELKFLIKDLNTSIQACNSQMDDQQAILLLINKKRHHVRRQRSVSNSNSWNSVESLNMRQFQDGKLLLSDDEEMPVKQEKIKRQASYKRSISSGSLNIGQKKSRTISSKDSRSPQIRIAQKDSYSSEGSIDSRKSIERKVSPQMKMKKKDQSPIFRRRSISIGSSSGSDVSHNSGRIKRKVNEQKRRNRIKRRS